MHSTRSVGNVAIPTRTSVGAMVVALAILLGVMLAGARTAFAQPDDPGPADAPNDAITLAPQAEVEVVEKDIASQAGAGEQADDAAVLSPQALGPIADQGAAGQNYAVFDPSTSTLTFKFGELPQGTAGTDYFVGFDTASTPYASDGDRPWYPKKTSVRHVVFDASVSGHLKPRHTAWWFGQFYSLEDVEGLEHLDTSEVASMAHMFDNCNAKLAALDLSVLDTSSATDMAGLLNGCKQLKTLTLGGGFSTANVRNMDNMFASCGSLASLDVSGLDTTSAQSMFGMFDGCSKLTSLDLTGFHTSQVQNMGRMFAGCSSLVDLQLSSGFDTSGVTDMIEMFSADSSIETLVFPASFNTSNVTNMRGMFHACTKLKNLDLSVFDTSKVTTFSQMFDICKSLESLDLSSFGTQQAKDLYHTFQGCVNLESIVFGNDFTVSNVETLDHAFEGCTSLTTLDVSRWNTSKASNLQSVFQNCKALAAIDLSSWDFSNAFWLNNMFSGCTSLTSVNLGNFKSDRDGMYLSSLFSGCTSLRSLDLSAWNTSAAKYMDKMFKGCTGLTDLDLTGFETQNVIEFSEMFNGCTSLLALDLSSFNTLSGAYMGDMFGNCPALQSVTLGKDFSMLGNDIWTDANACSLPVPAVTQTYNGLWWKGPGTMSYNKYGMRKLSGDDIAGTWTWSEGVAVVLSASPGDGGSVTASPQNTGAAGDSITLSATPGRGYKFVGWQLTSGDNTGALRSATESPTTFTFGASNGAVKATFEAVPYELVVGALGTTSFTYNGSAQAPTVTVKDAASGAALTEGTHYQLSFERDGSPLANPTDAGTYTVFVTGMGDYANAPTALAGTFTINPATITGVTAADKTYTGSALKPKPTVKAGDIKVPAGSYSASYSNNTNAGTATVTVTGKGNYAGKKSATFKIAAASLSGQKLLLSKTSFTYNGKVQKPTVQTIGGKALTAGTDYGTTYSNASSKAAGSYTVKVTGKGNYTGTSAKATYKITKAANPITLANKTIAVSYAKLKKAQQGAAISPAKKAQGKVTYSITKAVKGKNDVTGKFTINKSTGKVTVAKGLAKGTYKLTVKAQAAGNTNYKPGSKPAIITIQIK